MVMLMIRRLAAWVGRLKLPEPLSSSFSHRNCPNDSPTRDFPTEIVPTILPQRLFPHRFSHSWQWDEQQNCQKLSQEIRSLCPKMFKTPTSINLHKETHQVSKQLQCKFCMKSYPKYNLETHILLKYEVMENVKCETCNNVLKNAISLKCHISRAHTNQKTSGVKFVTTSSTAQLL